VRYVQEQGFIVLHDDENKLQMRATKQVAMGF
jgi:hypothetical protein